MRPPITATSIGWCYLLHMSRPLGNLTNPRAQAQHYSGWCADADGDATALERRIAQHLAGDGAKITKAAIAAGIEISLVATWRAPLAFEKYLKRRKEAPRLCPICCRARGRKVKTIALLKQLALPFDQVEANADVEPWPEGFEFPAPTLTRPMWVEFQRERPVGAPLVDDWDDGLL
jgi:hypothetical protein